MGTTNGEQVARFGESNKELLSHISELPEIMDYFMLMLTEALYSSVKQGVPKDQRQQAQLRAAQLSVALQRFLTEVTHAAITNDAGKMVEIINSVNRLESGER